VIGQRLAPWLALGPAFWMRTPRAPRTRDLKQNMVRFGYVLRTFGITSKGLGITAHGLRHEALIEEYIAITGQEPPPRAGRWSSARLGLLRVQRCHGSASLFDLVRDAL
jgi:hypothetical protein